MNTIEAISYEAFVEQEIKYWSEKGVKWKYAQAMTSNDDEKENVNKIKYTEHIIEEFIMTVYDTTAITQNTSAFTKLLMLFSHQ